MPPPSLTMTTELPILSSQGAPDRRSPSASKTDLTKPTTPATSDVKILGMTVGRPAGLDRGMVLPPSAAIGAGMVAWPLWAFQARRACAFGQGGAGGGRLVLVS